MAAKKRRIVIEKDTTKEFGITTRTTILGEGSAVLHKRSGVQQSVLAKRETLIPLKDLVVGVEESQCTGIIAEGAEDLARQKCQKQQTHREGNIFISCNN